MQAVTEIRWWAGAALDPLRPTGPLPLPRLPARASIPSFQEELADAYDALRADLAASAPTHAHRRLLAHLATR